MSKVSAPRKKSTAVQVHGMSRATKLSTSRKVCNKDKYNAFARNPWPAADELFGKTMHHKIKFLKPFTTDFIQTSEADLSQAACELLSQHLGQALFILAVDAGRTDGDTSYFSLMADETGHEFVARYFSGGIGRSGGIKPQKKPLQCATMAEIESRLGVSPGHLECEWAGVESAADAWEKKRQKSKASGAKPGQ